MVSSTMCDGVRERAIAWLADPYRYMHVHMNIYIHITSHDPATQHIASHRILGVSYISLKQKPD